MCHRQLNDLAESGDRGVIEPVRAGAECGGDVGHGRRVLGGDVEALAEAVHEAVRPHGVSTGESRWIRGPERYGAHGAADEGTQHRPQLEKQILMR